ncbi:GNAT family N-acetyltransferase [Streptosporangium sandarakinum]|uniref:GNAT family N-acetyltransferase n=1 Tax=Streptosporangium sandarakinum TaxID=1260955 RepID=UPI003715C38A
MKLAPLQLLRRSHRMEEFDCGSPAQSDWLRRYGRMAHTAGTSRVYVVEDLDAERVVGYYALAAGSMTAPSAPERLLKGVGRRDQPVILLTRLGVDRAAQGVGLGRALVADALRRVGNVADQIGVRALLIHCENEAARGFYTRIAEFESSPTDPLHLVLLTKDLRRSLGSGDRWPDGDHQSRSGGR